LLVYAVGQLGSSVPILPSALGVAEGSLTLALVGVGVRPADAVAAGLTYRFISFWLQLPVGWVVWMELRRRSSASAPDEPGLVPA
jgi:putative heme transporter